MIWDEMPPGHGSIVDNDRLRQFRRCLNGWDARTIEPLRYSQFPLGIFQVARAPDPRHHVTNPVYGVGSLADHLVLIQVKTSSSGGLCQDSLG